MPKFSEINGKTPEFMAGLKRFGLNPKGFLLIAGANGTGKTFSARAVYDILTRDSCSDNAFWNLVRLNAKWLQNFNNYGDNSYLLGEIVKAPLLVLDDVGAQKRTPSDAFLDFLYLIAEERYERKNEVGTIITTNLNSHGMQETMGNAFTSRVASGICLRCDGPDRRDSKF